MSGGNRAPFLDERVSSAEAAESADHINSAVPKSLNNWASFVPSGIAQIVVNGGLDFDQLCHGRQALSRQQQQQQEQERRLEFYAGRITCVEQHGEERGGVVEEEVRVGIGVAQDHDDDKCAGRDKRHTLVHATSGAESCQEAAIIPGGRGGGGGGGRGRGRGRGGGRPCLKRANCLLETAPPSTSHVLQAVFAPSVSKRAATGSRSVANTSSVSGSGSAAAAAVNSSGARSWRELGAASSKGAAGVALTARQYRPIMYTTAGAVGHGLLSSCSSLTVRPSGTKDRHSKVRTAKGLRDRRVRLSAPTAIEFFDVLDRLGYEQPSQAVDWLIKTARGAIDELPAPVGAALFIGPDGARIVTAAEQQNKQNQATISGKEEEEFALLNKPKEEDVSATGRTRAAVGEGTAGRRAASRAKARERARERAKEKSNSSAAAAAAGRTSSAQTSSCSPGSDPPPPAPPPRAVGAAPTTSTPSPKNPSAHRQSPGFPILDRNLSQQQFHHPLHQPPPPQQPQFSPAPPPLPLSAYHHQPPPLHLSPDSVSPFPTTTDFTNSTTNNSSVIITTAAAAGTTTAFHFDSPPSPIISLPPSLPTSSSSSPFSKLPNAIAHTAPSIPSNKHHFNSAYAQHHVLEFEEFMRTHPSAPAHDSSSQLFHPDSHFSDHRHHQPLPDAQPKPQSFSVFSSSSTVFSSPRGTLQSIFNPVSSILQLPAAGTTSNMEMPAAGGQQHAAAIMQQANYSVSSAGNSQHFDHQHARADQHLMVVSERSSSSNSNHNAITSINGTHGMRANSTTMRPAARGSPAYSTSDQATLSFIAATQINPSNLSRNDLQNFIPLRIQYANNRHIQLASGAVEHLHFHAAEEETGMTPANSSSLSYQ